jgi:hypothetical protein
MQAATGPHDGRAIAEDEIATVYELLVLGVGVGEGDVVSVGEMDGRAKRVWLDTEAHDDIHGIGERQYREVKGANATSRYPG